MPGFGVCFMSLSIRVITITWCKPTKIIMRMAVKHPGRVYSRTVVWWSHRFHLGHDIRLEWLLDISLWRPSRNVQRGRDNVVEPNLLKQLFFFFPSGMEMIVDTPAGAGKQCCAGRYLKYLCITAISSQLMISRWPLMNGWIHIFNKYWITMI